MNNWDDADIKEEMRELIIKQKAEIRRLEKGLEFMKKQWIRTLKCKEPVIWGGWPLDGLPVACDSCEACRANPQLKEEL